MSSKVKRFIYTALSVIILLAIWECGAILLNNKYFLPRIEDVVLSLIEIFSSEDFLIVVVMTIFRVAAALLIGVIIGVVAGLLSQKFLFIQSLLKPILLIIKSAPVATFIVLLWATTSGNSLAIIIAFLMVFPIICEGTTAALNNIDSKLEEVCTVFRFTPLKRIKHLVIPTLMKNLIPLVITSVGLAWKAEVAAEIIGYVSDSIGAKINDVIHYDKPMVFAWTIIIIVFSVALEILTRTLLGRLSKND